MSFSITEDEYKRLISRIVELESTVQQVVGISTPYQLGLRVEAIITQNSEIADKCDKLRLQMSEYIEKVNEDPAKSPTLLEAFDESNVTMTDIAQALKINVNYAHKILNGTSDNKSLKTRMLNYITKNRVIK